MEYQIWGRGENGAEQIDSFDSMKEARINLSEYRLAYGAGWNLWIKTVRVDSGKGKGKQRREQQYIED